MRQGRAGRSAGRGRFALAAGGAALLAIAAVVATAAFGLAGHATREAFTAVVSDPYVRRVAGFTVLQAALSALISVGLALPFARAAARRRHLACVRLLMALGSLAFVTPVIIGVFGIVQVHGRAGWVGEAARSLGLDPGAYLYGLAGILIAHVFFNMPFAARAMANAIGGVAPEQWRLAAQLGLRQAEIFRLIEWPAIRPVLFAILAMVFALCFTSFAVVLTLGGGPRATILEVAIYQALRFDFDVPRAVALALVQIVLAGLIAIALAVLGRDRDIAPPSGTLFDRPDRHGTGPALADAAAFALAGLAVVLPLAGIVLPGLASLSAERLAAPALWQAAAWSAAIALCAGLLALAIGLGLLLAIREIGVRRGHGGLAGAMEGAGSIILVTPPVLLGAGLFLALRERIDLFAAAPAIVVAVNAIAALPFVLRLLGPQVRHSALVNDRLCASVGLAGWLRWRLIDWPAIRPAAASALAIATTMAAGDLGIIALVGTPQTTTLPLLIFQLMGAYRMEEAGVAVIVLMAMALGLIVGIERLGGGGRRADA